jgi:PAS domain S-box-containing protein
MKDNNKRSEQLLKELAELQKRAAETEKTDKYLRESEALNNSDERYRNITENSSFGISACNETGQCIVANKALAEMVGATVEQVLSQNFYKLESWKKSGMLDTAKEVLASGEKRRKSFHISTSFGKNLWLDVTFVPYIEKGKKFLLFLAEDITERKKAEKALQKAHNELELRVKERTSELLKTNERLLSEIKERKKVEHELREAEKKLKVHANELSESNAALKVLLKQRAQDQTDFGNNILSNIKHLIIPYIEKLKKNKLEQDEIAYLNIIESNLNEIVSPFATKLSFQFLDFTPREIMIADIIKDGKQDKDIMEILNISLDTVKTHRKNIRRKLGIYGNRINLRTKLLSLIR